MSSDPRDRCRARRQVAAPYLLHRLSPSLMQPIARTIDRFVSRW